MHHGRKRVGQQGRSSTHRPVSEQGCQSAARYRGHRRPAHLARV